MTLRRNQAVAVVAPVLGILAIITPTLVWPPTRVYEAPLFPLIRTSIEGMGLSQFVLLLGVGLILGLIWRGRAWVIGLLAVSAFPAAAIAEGIKDPTTHNLFFPFELVMYGVFGLVVATGVVLVRLFRRMLGHSDGR